MKNSLSARSPFSQPARARGRHAAVRDVHACAYAEDDFFACALADAFPATATADAFCAPGCSSTADNSFCSCPAADDCSFGAASTAPSSCHDLWPFSGSTH
eukprot:14891-Hanusia_phi.AAC.1